MSEKRNKNEYVTKTDLEKLIKEQTRVLLNSIDSVMEKRLEKVESRLSKKIDGVQNTIDGYVKVQEYFKQEFLIMKEEIKQIKKAFKDKFGLEIKAI
jgi:hypothetical protein